MLRDEKGFTLLEIIVSLTILATAILALVQMFSGSLNQAAQGKKYLRAVYLAQQKFSQLELEDYKADPLEGEFENYKDYRWRVEMEPYDSAVNNEDAGIQMQKITLQVYWEEPGGEKQVQMVSLRLQGETKTAVPELLNPSVQENAAKAPTPPTGKTSNPPSPVPR